MRNVFVALVSEACFEVKDLEGVFDIDGKDISTDFLNYDQLVLFKGSNSEVLVRTEDIIFVKFDK